MNRRTKFNTSEYQQLRHLIKMKVNSDRNEQRKIRNKIRSIGFYYSAFSSKKGYDLTDLEHLIESGEITVIEDKFEPDIQQNKKAKIHTKSKSTNSIVIQLDDPIENGTFMEIENLDYEILQGTGIYCIRLRKNSRLPNKYQQILKEKSSRIIYIGIAQRQSLSERLSQEIHHKGAGTFFRSIGAVLQFSPIPKHLKNKSNQKNYKFSKADTEKVITWLKKNIEICVAPIATDFTVEKKLIEKYKPILNLTHNPEKCQQLIKDRKNCRQIAVHGGENTCANTVYKK